MSVCRCMPLGAQARLASSGQAASAVSADGLRPAAREAGGCAAAGLSRHSWGRPSPTGRAAALPPLRAVGRPPGPASRLAGGRKAEDKDDELDDSDFVEDLATGRTVRLVQWYPGHIARAERLLKEQLKLVDVVLDVRDARIPLATSHPSIPAWAANKTRLLVLAREDMVPESARCAWADHFGRSGEGPAYFVNAQSGDGVRRLARAAAAVGAAINEARKRKGLLPRAARAVAVGYPNVGKSALINRLLGRRAVASAPKPGVTRSLRWVAIDEGLHLLDSPGVLPPRLDDQAAAARLAMCDDIGEAAYTSSMVAAAFLARLRAHPDATELLARVDARYRLPLGALSPEDAIAALAAGCCRGEPERAGVLLLHDFRVGALGQIALEYPPPRG